MRSYTLQWLIREYFASLHFPTYSTDLAHLEKIGRTNADGNTILPAEEDWAY